MDLSHLNETQRAQVEAFVQQSPSSRPQVEQLLEKRAAATSPKERERFHTMLIWLVTPSKRSAAWIVAPLIIVPIVVMLGVTVYDDAQHESALRDGTAVVARIERVADGNCLVGEEGSRCLELSLRLWPTNAASYTASLTHAIDTMWFSRVQPGSYLTVVVDRNDPQHVTFDERAMQVAAPAPPPGASTP